MGNGHREQQGGGKREGDTEEGEMGRSIGGGGKGDGLLGEDGLWETLGGGKLPQTGGLWHSLIATSMRNKVTRNS